ncbi:hypothetical protein [Streptomyces aureoversilis]|uniref:Uncharacterized protein n=1 Tax=Streptomyces aureoversilis TaxID=67277 RepID=A0ABV9ZVN0_9ACTN
MLNALDPWVIFLTCIGVTSLIAAGVILLVVIVWGLREMARWVREMRGGPRGRHRAGGAAAEDGLDDAEPDPLAGLSLPGVCAEHGPDMHHVHADGRRTCWSCAALTGEA